MKTIALEPERCIFALMNTKRNRTFLDKVIHKKFFDMSIVYRQVLEYAWAFSDERLPSVAVSKMMMEKSGVTMEELDRAAYMTTMREFPAEMEKAGDSHYAVSNYLRRYGAVAMLDEDFLGRAAKSFGENFYMIPCTTDRIEVIAESKIELKKLNKILADWNAKQKERDVLSDNIYYYDRKKKQIEIAEQKKDKRIKPTE